MVSRVVLIILLVPRVKNMFPIVMVTTTPCSTGTKRGRVMVPFIVTLVRVYSLGRRYCRMRSWVILLLVMIVVKFRRCRSAIVLGRSTLVVALYLPIRPPL